MTIKTLKPVSPERLAELQKIREEISRQAAEATERARIRRTEQDQKFDSFLNPPARAAKPEPKPQPTLAHFGIAIVNRAAKPKVLGIHSNARKVMSPEQKAAEKRRYEANREQRRMENRQMAQRAKGSGGKNASK